MFLHRYFHIHSNRSKIIPDFKKIVISTNSRREYSSIYVGGSTRKQIYSQKL